MPPTMPNARRSNPVRSLDAIPLGMAKAVRSSDQQSFSAVTTKAIIQHYGSVQEAAFALGQVDPSLMMREFGACKFARFDEHADARARAAVSGALAAAYPAVRRQRIVELIDLLLSECA